MFHKKDLLEHEALVQHYFFLAPLPHGWLAAAGAILSCARRCSTRQRAIPLDPQQSVAIFRGTLFEARSVRYFVFILGSSLQAINGGSLFYESTLTCHNTQTTDTGSSPSPRPPRHLVKHEVCLLDTNFPET